MENIDTSYIREPVDRGLLLQELKQRHFLRKTNYGDKEIYVTTAHSSPNIMQEIGRLRELSFALDGGGTGKPVDIDEYDLLPEPHCYKQLFVWSPHDREIVGAYRFIHGTNILQRPDGTYATSAASEFHFSDEFVSDYLPFTVELGRAFVQPMFQPGNNLSKGLYSLDNLWDGLGALVAKYENIRYFFGKVTMYTGYNSRARNILLNFLHKYFPDPEHLVTASHPLDFNLNDPYISSLFEGLEYKDALKVLQKELKANGENIPPLIHSYMNLSPSMKVFDTAINDFFGGVEETGILIKISDIYPEKIDRHVKPILKWALDTKNKWWRKLKKRTNR